MRFSNLAAVSLELIAAVSPERPASSALPERQAQPLPRDADRKHPSAWQSGTTLQIIVEVVKLDPEIEDLAVLLLEVEEGERRPKVTLRSDPALVLVS